ncbi:MAG TPA: hypothetical protein ENJ95_01610 [Bacteroidetes bacterium]|nr:hypothetical protein [Bacteroidota bacterium]
MKNKIPFFLLFTLFVFSCTSESAPEEKQKAATAQPVQAADGQLKGGSLEELKEKALDENDTYGRVRQSLGVLQKEFNQAQQKAKKTGKMSVIVDEDFNLIIRNENKENVGESRVNLKDLNAANGGMRLLPDDAPGDYPGFSISVIEGRPGVEIYSNGEKVGELRELQIFLAGRESVERVVPAFVQALNVVHGKN